MPSRLDACPVTLFTLLAAALPCGCAGSGAGAGPMPGLGDSSSDGPGSTDDAAVDDGSPATSGADGPVPGTDEGSSDGEQSDASSDGDATGSATDDSTGASACDLATHRCVDATPDGWHGPVAIAQGAMDATPVECADLDDPDARTLFADLVAAPAECDCSCGAPQGGTCAATTEVRYYPVPLTGPYAPNYPANINQADCLVPAWWDDVESGAAVAMSGVIPSRWSADPVEPAGGSCSASSQESVADAGFTARVQACSAPAIEGSCEDGGTCVVLAEDPFTSTACIWQEGDVPCPEASTYSVRSVGYGGFTDDRDCSSCSCGTPTGLSCDDATAYVWTGGQSHAVPADDACHYVGSGEVATGVSFSPGSPSGGQCQASGGAPIGAATPTDPVTMCCVE